jgi:hypothetical protein
MNEKTKLLLANTLIVSLLPLTLLLLAYFGIHVFQGDESMAATLLGTLISSLGAIIAIVFTLIVFVSQFTLGKYVTRTIDYVLWNWRNVTVLAFGIIVLLTNVVTFWNLSIQSWRSFVDLCVILSISFILTLFPFFLSLTKSLKPERILYSIQNEITGRKSKDLEFALGKLDLMFSIVRRFREGGETADALLGIGLIGGTVRSIDLEKSEFVFLDSIISKLGEMGVESLKEQPSLSLSCIHELRRIIDSVEPKVSFIAINVTNRAVSAALAILDNSIRMRQNGRFMTATYSLVLRSYEALASKDAFVAKSSLDALSTIFDRAKALGVEVWYYLPHFESHQIITRLLKKGKTDKALILFRVLSDLYPKDSDIASSSILLLFDVVQENEDVATKMAEIVRESLRPLQVEAKMTDKAPGRSIKPSENKIEIEVGNKEEYEIALWIQKHLNTRVNRKAVKIRELKNSKDKD